MITKPTLLLDKDRCLKNIQQMVDKAKTNGLDLRPHFKTHQSHTIGAWFRAFGISKIAVSSLTMAEYFARDGWDDITVAFPCNILEIATINDLASKIKLNILVQSTAVLAYLSEHLTAAVNAYIKIDLGYGRTGIKASDSQVLDELVKGIASSPKLNFVGFLGHAGHSYNARNLADIQLVHNEALSEMEKVYQKYSLSYPNISISIGDTPTCSRMTTFGCATELRPGNFVFYDVMQEQIGACEVNQIAVAMACPVVAIHPERNELIIYGGGVHFSKDVCQHKDYGTCYGLVVEKDENSWQSPIPDAYLARISQEHGVVKGSPDFIQKCSVGDILSILPVHSCMTADLLKSIQTTTGETIKMMGYFR